MDLGPLVGNYDSALSSMVKMKRADVNSKNSPLFEGKKGPLPPCLRALLDPSCQETIPSACSDKLIPENVFFSLPCYNVFSIFNPQPSKLPSSLQTRSDEWSFKNQILNAWLVRFTCLSSLILQRLLNSGQSLAYILWEGFVCHFFKKCQIPFLVFSIHQMCA